MSKIENLLEANGLAMNNLPKSVIQKIEHLNSIRENINETKNELQEETDEGVRKEMRDAILKGEAYARELEEEALLATQAFVAEQKGDGNEDDEREQERIARRKAIMQKRREERNRAKMQQAATQTDTASVTQLADGGEAPKKKNGKALAWIFGGVVLVLTLGAVNTMSNK